MSALEEVLDTGSIKHIPTEIYADSKSLYDAFKLKKNVTEKRLRIDITILQELLELKIVSKLHCSLLHYTRCQLTNALMKKGASWKELLYILQKGILQI